jgi:hypothetical protein
MPITATRSLRRDELDGRTNAAKDYDRLVGAVVADLGGTENITAIERRIVEAFAGSAILLDALNAKVLLGLDVDIGQHALIVSSVVKTASRRSGSCSGCSPLKPISPENSGALLPNGG